MAPSRGTHQGLPCTVCCTVQNCVRATVPLLRVPSCLQTNYATFLVRLSCENKSKHAHHGQGTICAHSSATRSATDPLPNVSLRVGIRPPNRGGHAASRAHHWPLRTVEAPDDDGHGCGNRQGQRRFIWLSTT